MAKKTLYYSTDKLYKITKNKISKKNLFALCIIATIVLAIIAFICFNESVVINSKESNIKYNEIGNVDYKVYLKDNNYYESSYLESGMQYVANLIKTINVKFNYEIHTTDDLDFTNEYKIVSELLITERNDPSSILYSKKDTLIPLKNISKRDDNLVINEEIDIDYDKYNDIVNNYKKDLGLIVSSNLKLTLETNTSGGNGKENLSKNNKLQIIIPLSEATLKINMNANKINNSASLDLSKSFINIKNKLLFIVCISATILTVLAIILDIYIYLKLFNKDPYTIKLNNILRNYDRLIVTGKVNLDESKYPNIIYPKTFKEMVDAAENLGVPIMHYEVIKGEKSIFTATKDDTLVKYRVTKAYLNNKRNKEEEL